MLTGRLIGGINDPFWGQVVLLATAGGATVNRTGGSGYWDLAANDELGIKDIDYIDQGAYAGTPRISFLQRNVTPDQRAVTDDDFLSWADRSFWVSGSSGTPVSALRICDSSNVVIGLSNFGSAWNWSTSDMTWECWFRPLDTVVKQADAPLMSAWGQDVNGGNLFSMILGYDIPNDEYELDFTYKNTSDVTLQPFDAVGALDPDGNWHHIAVTRKDTSDWTVWFDGVSQATASQSSAFKDASSDEYFDFMGWDRNITESEFNADYFRITKACRYTSAFTPPSFKWYGAD